MSNKKAYLSGQSCCCQISRLRFLLGLSSGLLIKLVLFFLFLFFGVLFLALFLFFLASLVPHDASPLLVFKASLHRMVSVST